MSVNEVTAAISLCLCVCPVIRWTGLLPVTQNCRKSIPGLPKPPLLGTQIAQETSPEATDRPQKSPCMLPRKGGQMASKVAG